MQADLRHFAAERDWQPFHTPKNLTTALMVEAAELAEIFQWMTPEEFQLAHQNAGSKQRIGEEVADVLLYLLQVADHSQIDIAQAVKDKLGRNALKYPATRAVGRASPAHAAVAGTQVLLDYENVQPTEDELRTLVPDASQVWVFHGPHQRQIEQRFSSFGTNVTAVPISRTGKNALDFHLSFYMGYTASRNQASAMVVVANDKGYEPMLEHARSMGVCDPSSWAWLANADGVREGRVVDEGGCPREDRGQEGGCEEGACQEGRGQAAWGEAGASEEAGTQESSRRRAGRQEGACQEGGCACAISCGQGSFVGQ